jgi:hypothetical protein
MPGCMSRSRRTSSNRPSPCRYIEKGIPGIVIIHAPKL